MTYQKSTDEKSSVNLVEFVLRWKKELAYVVLAAIAISALVSFLITPKYRSTVIMFPTQTSSISKALLDVNGTSKDDILKFGEEEEAEQMLQILNSDYIKSYVCNKYRLMDHYRIDSSDTYKNTRLYDEFEDNINFERTEFMSVKIDVYDTDPQMAADICNTISDLLDSVKNNMQKVRARAALGIVEGSYLALKKEIQEINDSLKTLRLMGINDYETQSQVFNEQYATAIARNNSAGARQLEEKLKILSNYGGAYVSLRELHEEQIKQLALIKAKYEEARVDAEKIITQKFIVNRAVKAEKKAYPIRWLIVTVSALSSLLIAMLVLMIFENYKMNQKN
jgi:LPS O-antigen subunit length determinant protein (WzzB/FepE family)